MFTTRCAAALLFASAASVSFAQTASSLPRPDARSLAIAERTLVSDEFAGAIMHPFKCDEAGNVYVRKYSIRNPGYTISKLQPDGKSEVSFELSAAGVDYGGGDFDVRDDGSLYRTAWRRQAGSKLEILEYRADGTLKGKITLDERVNPSQLAVFKSGGFLLSAMVPGTRLHPDELGSFTAIYDGSGKLLKQLKLQDDDAIQEAVDKHDPRVSDITTGGGNQAVKFGQAVSSPDGYVYLMRWVNPVIVYQISPGGNVKRFEVDPRDSGYEASEMRVTAGRVAVLFWQHGKSPKLEVLDLASGNVTESYSLDRDFGLAFVCYKPGDFTFLRSGDDGRMSLDHAVPK